MFRRDATSRQTLGWYVEPKLNINSRLFWKPGFRIDNNGLAGKNAKFLRLPKMDFSWIASDESFFPMKDKIQMLRVRTAFGVAGAQPNPAEGIPYFQRLDFTQMPRESYALYGKIIQNSLLGNTRLRPERGHEIETGFDLEVWNNRVTLNVTRYWGKRIDAIVQQRVGLDVGGNSINVNLGDIEKYGTEISASAQLIERQQVGWNVSMTATRNSNKVVRIGNIEPLYMGSKSVANYYASGTEVRKGYPLNAIWGPSLLGYSDVNGDGILQQEEILLGARSFLGSTDPKYELTGNSGLNLIRGLVNVNVAFSYKNGFIQQDLASTSTGTDSRDPGSTRWKTTPWTLLKNRDGLSLAEQAELISGAGLRAPVNVLRLNTFSVNANLGPHVAQLLRGRYARLGLSGSNLGLWTTYHRKDPNVNGFSTGEFTADLGQLPPPRVWRLSLSVGN
jgi:hypothetical protein